MLVKKLNIFSEVGYRKTTKAYAFVVFCCLFVSATHEDQQAAQYAAAEDYEARKGQYQLFRHILHALIPHIRNVLVGQVVIAVVISHLVPLLFLIFDGLIIRNEVR